MTHSVGVESQNYQVLRARLLSVEPELDERTLTDTLEGLTDLHEIIAAIVRAALDDEDMVSALKDRLKVLETRMERLAQRAEQRRRIARDTMVECALKKIVAPDFTLSTRPGVPSLTVIDEQQVPSQFWEPRAPRLNRQSLLASLKQGENVPGVALSEPQAVLSVRTR